MRAEYTRAARGRPLPDLLNAGEHVVQDGGRTRDGRGTERRHTVLGQRGGDFGDRAALVQRVRAVDTMHVHVDESWNNHVSRQVEMLDTGAAGPCASHHVDDAVVLEHERAGAANSIRKHQIRARENDHCNVIYRECTFLASTWAAPRRYACWPTKTAV